MIRFMSNTYYMKISIIVAASENNVIGRNNTLPWHLPDDLKFFRTKTAGHPVIMGRKNFESIVAAIGGPLPKRRNIIVTRNSEYTAEGCDVVSSLHEAVQYGRKEIDSAEMFIIGGGDIYKQALQIADTIYLTRIHAWIQGDVYFPEISPDIWEEVEKKEHTADAVHKFAFTFFTYKRKDLLHL